MKPRLRLTRRSTAIAAAALLAVVATTAYATTRTVTLNLEGGYGNVNTSTRCGAVNHYTKYHLGHTIQMNGTVLPVPSGAWKVKIKVKRCMLVNGVWGFHRVWAGHFSGNRLGWFYPAFKPGKLAAYFVRAYYYYSATGSFRSAKQNFLVTR